MTGEFSGKFRFTDVVTLITRENYKCQLHAAGKKAEAASPWKERSHKEKPPPALPSEASTSL